VNAARSGWTQRLAAAARPHAAQRLLAVPWRHPALILACAIAGAGATAALSLRPVADPAPRAIAHLLLQPIRPEPDGVASAPVLAGAGGPGLRLDLELGPDLAAAPGEVVAADAAARLAAADPLPVEAAREDAIDALLRQAPPAAGRPLAQALEEAPAPGGLRGGALVPGLLAGLLLGLLAAATRELRGDRMRSPREAEWALGAPVLGAIPTLSTRARGALLAPPAGRA